MDEKLNLRGDLMKDLEELANEYRQTLINLEQQMQSTYDKAVMTLSGGALGISLAFLKDVADKTALKNTGCRADSVTA